jgi:hypothetical protein
VRNSITSNDNGLNAGLNTGVQNWYDLRSERSVSEMDVSQAFVFSYVWELPSLKTTRVLRALTGGWQWSGVTTYRTGFPLVMSAPIPGGGNRPNSTGRSAEITGRRDRDSQLNEWFKTSEFLPPPSFSNGNVGRTVPDVRTPGYGNWDVSLVKNMMIKERVNLQWRAESFNLMNAVRLWNPNTNRGSVQFGQINSTTGLPRVHQLALKLLF